MSSLVVGGAMIPVAPNGASQDRLDAVDRRRAFDNTYRASATGNAKRDWRFSTRPLSPGTAGLYERVLAAVAAQSCSGDLLGGSRNDLLVSEQFNSATWAKTNITVTANVTTAPDGTVSADQIGATASAGTSLTQNAVIAGTQATFSIYAKKGSGATDGNVFGIRNATTATDLAFVSINYDTGVLTQSVGVGATVELLPDGWYRLVIPATSGITSGNTLTVYAGFVGSVESAGEFFNVWGAQLEPGSTASPYIQTTTVVINTLTTSCCSEITGRTPIKTPGGHMVVLDFALHEV